MEAANEAGVGRGIIRETSGEFMAGRVADAYDVALLEIAHHVDDANGQKALRAQLDGLAGAVVDDVMAPRPGRQADPPLAGAMGLAMGQEQGADGIPREHPRKGLLTLARCDDDRASRLGNQAG